MYKHTYTQTYTDTCSRARQRHKKRRKFMEINLNYLIKYLKWFKSKFEDDNRVIKNYEYILADANKWMKWILHKKFVYCLVNVIYESLYVICVTCVTLQNIFPATVSREFLDNLPFETDKTLVKYFNQVISDCI